jgi:hypothetical protein
MGIWRKDWHSILCQIVWQNVQENQVSCRRASVQPISWEKIQGNAQAVCRTRKVNLFHRFGDIANPLNNQGCEWEALIYLMMRILTLFLIDLV